MTAEHYASKWPMPLMFGNEDYAFSLIDISDPRYSEETATMSGKLVRLYSDVQIIEHEWRKTYKHFVYAERRRDNLTPGVLQKSRDKAEDEVEAARVQLLSLQDQRDLFHSLIDKVWARCAQIKASIDKERALESLRTELNDAIKQQYPMSDPFWRTKFKVRSPSIQPSRTLTKVK